MSDNMNGSQKSIPVIPRSESEDDRIFLELQKKDHTRLIKLTKLLRHTDELEERIYDIVHGIADNAFAPEDPPYDPETIELIIGSYFPITDVLTPEFLRRYAFPFQLLRMALAIYQLNPVTDHQLSTIRKTEAEKRNRGLEQLMWFQLLVGASTEQVESNLIEYRRLQSGANAPFSPHNTPLRDLRKMEDQAYSQPRSIRDAQVPSRRPNRRMLVYIVTIHPAAKLPMQLAQ